MISKTPIFLFFIVLIIYLTPGDTTTSYRNTRGGERPFVALNVNISFSRRDESSKICQAPNIVPVCLGKIVELACTHNKLEDIGLGKNNNFSFAEPRGQLARLAGRAVFSTDQKYDVTKNDCYFCWVNTTGQPLQRSQAVIPAYYECSKLMERKDSKAVLGGSVTLTCLNPKVPSSAVWRHSSDFKTEWYFEDTDYIIRKLNISDANNDGLKLHINNFTKKDMGSYWCHIWLNVPKYRHEREFALRFAQPPDSPFALRCNKTNDSLILEWNQNETPLPRVDTPNTTVESYKLEYMRLGEDSAWRVRVLPGENRKFALGYNTDMIQSNAEFTHLFRIAAVNVAGLSNAETISCTL